MSRGHFHLRSDPRTTLAAALALTLAFAGVELVTGWLSGSLALASDGVHMVSDATALAVALLAVTIGRRGASDRHTFGLQRAEVIGALANAMLMLAVVVVIVVEATGRMLDPRPVASVPVMLVALLGLAVNGVVAWMLSRGRSSLSQRAALLHVLGDLLGSLAALTAGAVIYFTGWLLIDPILSLTIVGLILISTLRLLRDVLHVLMEGVPHHLRIEDVGIAIAEIDGVRNVHDLHIWALSAQRVALSAHLEVTDMVRWPQILARAQAVLRGRFDIEHITLQPEVAPSGEPVQVASVHLIHGARSAEGHPHRH